MGTISIAALKQKLKGLKKFGIPLSELERLSDHQDLLPTDKFTIAREAPNFNTLTDQTHKDLNVDYSVLSANFVKKFKKDDITTAGTWTFGSTTTSRIYSAKTEPWNKTHLEMNLGNHGAVTIDFYNKNLGKLVEELSVMYFDCNSSTFKLASRTGDIVTTKKDNLNSYTFGNGSWQKLQHSGSKGNHVMILGVGPSEANDYTKHGNTSANEVNVTSVEATGGVYNSRIEIRHFPNHKHKFTADRVNFTMVFRLRGTVCPLACKGDAMIDLSQAKKKGTPVQGCHSAVAGTLTPFRMTGETSLTSANSQWINKLSVDSNICDSSGNIVATESDYTAHNNIPPVIFYYLQKRIT